MTSFKNTLETTQTDDVESPVKTYRRIKPAQSPDSPTSPEHRPVKIKAESSPDSPEASRMPLGSPTVPAAPEKVRKRRGGKTRKVEVGAEPPSGADANIPVAVATRLPAGAMVDADMPFAVATRLPAGAKVDADMPVAVVARLPTSARAVPVDETQIASPDSRPLSPIQEEAAGGTQVIDWGESRTVVPPVDAGAEVKGVCNYCGKTVLRRDARVQFPDKQYAHEKCAIKGPCQKCGKPVMAKSKRLGDDKGNYWHAECGTAAPTLGECPKCGKWVLKSEGGTRIQSAGKAASYFHAACAPPS